MKEANSEQLTAYRGICRTPYAVRWTPRRSIGATPASRDKPGYIALISFLIVSAVALFVGVALALLAVSEAQMGLSDVRGRRAHALAEGCAEDALLSAHYSVDYAGGIKSYPEGSCDVAVVKDGSNWTITTTATASGHTKRVEVRMNRGNEIVITDWKEIE